MWDVFMNCEVGNVDGLLDDYNEESNVVVQDRLMASTSASTRPTTSKTKKTRSKANTKPKSKKTKEVTTKTTKTRSKRAKVKTEAIKKTETSVDKDVNNPLPTSEPNNATNTIYTQGFPRARTMDEVFGERKLAYILDAKLDLRICKLCKDPIIAQLYLQHLKHKHKIHDLDNSKIKHKVIKRTTYVTCHENYVKRMGFPDVNKTTILRDALNYNCYKYASHLICVPNLVSEKGKPTTLNLISKRSGNSIQNFMVTESAKSAISVTKNEFLKISMKLSVLIKNEIHFKKHNVVFKLLKENLLKFAPSINNTLLSLDLPRTGNEMSIICINSSELPLPKLPPPLYEPISPALSDAPPFFEDQSFNNDIYFQQQLFYNPNDQRLWELQMKLEELRKQQLLQQQQQQSQPQQYEEKQQQQQPQQKLNTDVIYEMVSDNEVEENDKNEERVSMLRQESNDYFFELGNKMYLKISKDTIKNYNYTTKQVFDAVFDYKKSLDCSRSITEVVEQEIFPLFANFYKENLKEVNNMNKINNIQSPQYMTTENSVSIEDDIEKITEDLQYNLSLDDNIEEFNNDPEINVMVNNVIEENMPMYSDISEVDESEENNDCELQSIIFSNDEYGQLNNMRGIDKVVNQNDYEIRKEEVSKSNDNKEFKDSEQVEVNMIINIDNLGETDEERKKIGERIIRDVSEIIRKVSKKGNNEDHRNIDYSNMIVSIDHISETDEDTNNEDEVTDESNDREVINDIDEVITEMDKNRTANEDNDMMLVSMILDENIIKNSLDSSENDTDQNIDSKKIRENDIDHKSFELEKNDENDIDQKKINLEKNEKIDTQSIINLEKNEQQMDMDQSINLEKNEQMKLNQSINLEKNEQINMDQSVNLEKNEKMNTDQNVNLEKNERINMDQNVNLEKNEQINMDQTVNLETNEQIDTDQSINLEKNEKMNTNQSINLEKDEKMNMDQNVNLEKNERMNLVQNVNLEKNEQIDTDQSVNFEKNEQQMDMDQSVNLEKNKQQMDTDQSINVEKNKENDKIVINKVIGKKSEVEKSIEVNINSTIEKEMCIDNIDLNTNEITKNINEIDKNDKKIDEIDRNDKKINEIDKNDKKIDEIDKNDKKNDESDDDIELLYATEDLTVRKIRVKRHRTRKERNKLRNKKDSKNKKNEDYCSHCSNCNGNVFVNKKRDVKRKRVVNLEDSDKDLAMRKQPKNQEEITEKDPQTKLLEFVQETDLMFRNISKLPWNEQKDHLEKIISNARQIVNDKDKEVTILSSKLVQQSDSAKKKDNKSKLPKTKSSHRKKLIKLPAIPETIDLSDDDEDNNVVVSDKNIRNDNILIERVNLQSNNMNVKQTTSKISDDDSDEIEIIDIIENSKNIKKRTLSFLKENSPEFSPSTSKKFKLNDVSSNNTVSPKENNNDNMENINNDNMENDNNDNMENDNNDVNNNNDNQMDNNSNDGETIKIDDKMVQMEIKKKLAALEELKKIYNFVNRQNDEHDYDEHNFNKFNSNEENIFTKLNSPESIAEYIRQYNEALKKKEEEEEVEEEEKDDDEEKEDEEKEDEEEEVKDKNCLHENCDLHTLRKRLKNSRHFDSDYSFQGDIESNSSDYKSSEEDLEEKDAPYYYTTPIHEPDYSNLFELELDDEKRLHALKVIRIKRNFFRHVVPVSVKSAFAWECKAKHNMEFYAGFDLKAYRRLFHSSRTIDNNEKIRRLKNFPNLQRFIEDDIEFKEKNQNIPLFESLGDYMSADDNIKLCCNS